jgi:MFS family permease
MNFQFFTGHLTISSRRFIAVTFLTSGTLAWFFLLQVYIDDIFFGITQDDFWVEMCRALFFGFGIFSSLAGGLIAKKLDRKKFFLPWIVLGIISTASLALIQGIVYCVISSILLGLSLGFGLPASMAFLADFTTVEERGRVSGTTILETFIIAFLTIAIARIPNSIIANIVLIAVVRSISLLALILDKSEPGPPIEKTSVPNPTLKKIIFYIVPWMMFVVASSFAWNLIPETEQYESVRALATVFRYAFIAIFGFFGGIFADRIGRKTPIITGLIILGVSFGLLGFVMSPESAFIYLIASGIAWGLFLTIYLAIPGDLSISGSREKFYALGTIAPMIILFGYSMADPAIFFNMSASSFSQILSIILFVSIIPILLAEETLEESKIRKRKMEEHIQRVAKIAHDVKKSE